MQRMWRRARSRRTCSRADPARSPGSAPGRQARTSSSVAAATSARARSWRVAQVALEREQMVGEEPGAGAEEIPIVQPVEPGGDSLGNLVAGDEEIERLGTILAEMRNVSEGGEADAAWRRLPDGIARPDGDVADLVQREHPMIHG